MPNSSAVMRRHNLDIIYETEHLGSGHAMPSGLTVPTSLKDRMRLWKDGVRDLVMEICCALHNFRVRLTPWQPMV